MSLTPGQELLQFKLIEKIGEGGMGVVWRALDTTLDRTVAIKVLPESFANDTDRAARFEREAKLLASLNHPNIASIYSVHRVDGRHLIALELVEGEDLAEATSRGALPVDDAIQVCIGIAQALEAAHESGVIHRDLKPANVKLASDGTVKVLDFGLAKAIDPVSSADGASPTFAPTVTSAGTRAGMILGTAAYMSPEQARGKPLDRRTDLWSFGCVLYECLTGVVLFRGETVSDSLAAILRKEVDYSLIPTTTPPSVVRLLKRCLTRDPALRQQNAGDARIELLDAQLADPLDEPREVSKSAASTWALAALVLVLGLAAGWAIKSWWAPPNTDEGVTVLRLAVPVDDSLKVTSTPRFTPEGESVVFMASDVTPGANHDEHLYVQRLVDGSTVQFEGSKGVKHFAVSPDGESVAFLASSSGRQSSRQLYRAPLDQRTPPQRLEDSAPDLQSLIWLSDETIVAINDDDEKLVFFSADGRGEFISKECRGDVAPFGMSLSDVLPGGRYLLMRGATFETGAYSHYTAVIDTETGEFERILLDASQANYLPSGHIAFGRGGQLMVVPFDVETRKTTGPAQVVMDGLWSYGSFIGGMFAVSSKGDLLYLGGAVQGSGRQLRVLNRDGTHTAWSDDSLFFTSVIASPDGKWIATQVDNTAEGDALLQIRLSRADRPRWVTLDAPPSTDCVNVVWSNDSTRVAYRCHDNQKLSVLVVDASSKTRLRTLVEQDVINSLNLIGFIEGDRHLLAYRLNEAGEREFVTIDTEATDSTSAMQPVSVHEEGWDRFDLSRDGRMLIYESHAAGRPEICVRTVSKELQFGPRMPVDLSGRWAFWSSTIKPDLYEIVFSVGGSVSTATLSIGADVEVTDSAVVVADSFDNNSIYVERLNDDQLIFIQISDGERGSSDFRFVQNWESEISRLVRAPSN